MRFAYCKVDANKSERLVFPSNNGREVLNVKTYIVYINGVEAGKIKAASHNAAEKKAQAKNPGKQVSVEYTEV